MSNGQAQMLREIQQLEFTAVDYNLFLDSHPGDQAALRDYYLVAANLHEKRKRYEEIYGPLTAGGFTPAQYPWLWVEGPWPWEIEY